MGPLDLSRFSGNVEGMISRSVRPIYWSMKVSIPRLPFKMPESERTCASNAFLRGLADARITRCPFNIFRMGISSGNGSRGPRIGMTLGGVGLVVAIALFS